MSLKREVIDEMTAEGIIKFILIGENVLNFHASDDSYYEEWWQDVDDEDGWIAMINFRQHILEEASTENIDSYINLGGDLNDMEWRKFSPNLLFQEIDEQLKGRLLIP